MSTFYPADITCIECAHSFQVEVVRGIHITRLPWARQQILDGVFQVFECPECGEHLVAEGPTVYTDFHRNQYVAIESAGSTTWQTAELRHQTIFHESFECGPTLAQEMGRKFIRRVVFGFLGLREKLLLWDANLDDYVVEAVKGDLIAKNNLEGEVLSLAAILDGGHLTFGRFPPRPKPETLGEQVVYHVKGAREFITAPAALYQRRAANRNTIVDDYPWLKDDWLVDISEGHQYLDS